MAELVSKRTCGDCAVESVHCRCAFSDSVATNPPPLAASIVPRPVRQRVQRPKVVQTSVPRRGGGLVEADAREVVLHGQR